MDRQVERLVIAHTRLLRDVVTSASSNDRDSARAQLQELQNTLEELELVAQAATPASANDAALPAALTPDVYATYLLVLLLAEDLNNARFLWKRIPVSLKQSSELLRHTWAIGRALWQRDFAAAYAAMDATWPQALEGLVHVLRDWTRDATADLLSNAYATLSLQDAALALGFAESDALVDYCEARKWTVDTTEQLVRPVRVALTHVDRTGLEQLESLSHFVLHLEQRAVVKLP